MLAEEWSEKRTRSFMLRSRPTLARSFSQLLPFQKFIDSTPSHLPPLKPTMSASPPPTTSSAHGSNLTEFHNRSSSLSPMQTLDPSPASTPSQSSSRCSSPSAPSQRLNSSSSSSLGLSHSPIYYLSRLHRYSSFAIAPFLTLHVANVALIPLLTRSVQASEPYLLLTRPYYQSSFLEPLVVFAPVGLHVLSGVALRVYRRVKSAEYYSTPRWPALSTTSVLGYALLPLVAVHAAVNRLLPLVKEGDSSSIGLGYVSHGFALRPLTMTIAYAALVGVGSWHIVNGWARWLAVGPETVTGKERIRRSWGVNLASAVVAGVWMAGGLGVIGTAGKAQGWVGGMYDQIYASIPGFGFATSTG